MKRPVLFIILSLLSISIFAQGEINSNADTLRKDALNVYFEDASSYLKENIPFINYVRDRKVADMVIIKASERTGSGSGIHSFS